MIHELYFCDLLTQYLYENFHEVYITTVFLFSIIGLQAQIPQDLLDKAKMSGITDDQIQQELAKRGMGMPRLDSISALDTKVTGRTISPTIGDILPLEIQRELNQPEEELEYTVFGREIFSNRYLTFAPDLNAPTPKNYRLAAGDELLINIWGGF